jgi:hypothetical protein
MMTGEEAKGIRISGAVGEPAAADDYDKPTGKGGAALLCSSLCAACTQLSGLCGGVVPHHFVSAVLGPAFLARRRRPGSSAVTRPPGGPVAKIASISKGRVHSSGRREAAAAAACGLQQAQSFRARLSEYRNLGSRRCCCIIFIATWDPGNFSATVVGIRQG